MTTPLETAEDTALTNEAANLKEAEKPMYGIHYGAQYEHGMTTKEVAAEIRKALRKLSKSNHSPLSGAKVSVRYESFAGGTAVRVQLGLPFPTDNPNYDHMSADPAERAYLTPAAKAAKQIATEIHESFNYDGSDMMTDYFNVKFYGQVTVYEMKEDK